MLDIDIFNTKKKKKVNFLHNHAGNQKNKTKKTVLTMLLFIRLI